MKNLFIKKLDEKAYLPEYAHKGDACFDVFSLTKTTIEAGKWKLIKTGLQVDIPRGYEFQVRTKSGTAKNSGVFVLNSPGTIDENYQGELGIVLMNLSEEPYQVEAGQKVAQCMIHKVVYCKIKEVLFIKKRGARGEGGFGSSGLIKK